MRVRVKSQSGQAAVEYILLLIITVALILLLMTRFFKPLQTFISAYMGDYTECLLRTGELPSLGNDDSSSTLSDQGCNAKFEPASFAGGRPSKGSGANGNTANNSKSKSDSGSGGGGSGSTVASSSSSGGGNLRSPRGGTRSSDHSGPAGKVVEIALDDNGGNGFFRSGAVGSAPYRQSKTMSIGLAGLTEEQKKKIQKKEQGPTRLISTDGIAPPPKKMTVKPPEKKVEMIEEDESFTIGNFIRMLFIIGIILAIVVFVGGQVLQMSKSYDK